MKAYLDADCGNDQFLITKIRHSLKNINKLTPQPKVLSGSSLRAYREKIKEALMPLMAGRRRDARPETLWIGFKDKTHQTNVINL